MPKKIQCEATTKAGKRCRNPVAEGSTHCSKHQVTEIKPNASEGLFADGLKMVFDAKNRSMHFDRDDEEIQLWIKNRWNSTSIGVTANAETRIGDLVETSVQYFCLPPNDDEGKPFPYYLHFCREDVELDNATLVYHNPIRRGDVLRLDLARPDRYHFAISFAGEDREIAETIATALTARRMTVFYDDYERDNLWGKDLYQHLANVYSKAADFCIIIVSEHYANKLWTKHELRSAQERAFEENSEYLLPIRLDDTPIPGLPKTVGYIDWNSTTIDEIANSCVRKLMIDGKR